jgi:hypothetical protein
MNEELFEKTAASRLTRRTIVKTGTKLAYTAPVVAASMKLGTRSTRAQDEVVSPGGVGNPGFCGHSIGGEPFDPEGCKGTCNDACPQNEADFAGRDSQTKNPCEEVCEALCKVDQGNECVSDDACSPACFTCTYDSDGKLESVQYSATCGGGPQSGDRV